MANCCCVRTVTSAALSSTAMQLTLDNPPNTSNGCAFKFKIGCNIANNNSTYVPVSMNVNIAGTLTEVPVLESKYGNQVYSNELCTNKVYCCHFGSIPTNHVIINNP